MKKARNEIVVVERTVNKPIRPGAKKRAENWLADILFEDCLERKNLKVEE